MARFPSAAAAPTHASPPWSAPPALRWQRQQEPALALVARSRSGSSSTSGDAGAENRRAIAWELQLIGWIPLSPFAAGAMVALAIGCALLAIRWAAAKPLCAESGLAPAESLISAWIVAALIGYTMAAGRYLNAAILGDLYESAGRDRGVVRELADSTVFSSAIPVLRKSRIAGAVGALVGLGILQVVGAGAASVDNGFTAAERLSWLVLVPLLCFLLARATFNTILGARDRGDATSTPTPPPIDLLDLRSVYAQGRIGLRLALVWIAGGTISSLFIFDPKLATPVLPLLLSGIAVAVAALLLPARRLHRGIREAKYRELDRLQDELHRVRDDVLAGRASEGGQLADLLAYRSHLEEIREWPFDNPTVTRFLLYLLIPIGSWLGGALVERVVSNLLD